jgi:hypothetical protein
MELVLSVLVLAVSVANAATLNLAKNGSFETNAPPSGSSPRSC